MSDPNDISSAALRDFIDIVDRVLDECDRELLPAERLAGYLADACTNLEQVMRERDEREALVQQYRAQHDAEARRRGCPFCTCDVCAAAMRRTVVLP